jgi:glycosyltransferase involved in cell wall biosynthesis
MKDISILIPTYNHVCVELVSSLQQQASQLPINYEIIVADDGSTLAATIEANRAISEYPNCQYIERLENSGRAAIRNFLAEKSSYPWLLFIDSDMVVRRADFLRQYVDTPDEQAVWDGGISVGGDGMLLSHNLRYMYEMSNKHLHSAAQRQQKPYCDFHTANFMVSRQLMSEYPFDLRFRHYGYEDVLFGMQLKRHHIPIYHIDNPLSFEIFEENDHFLSKTEEGLRTLHQFQDELQGYSRLLDLARRLAPVAPLVRYMHRHIRLWERRILLRRPTLLLFNLYRIGYFLSIRPKREQNL